MVSGRGRDDAASGGGPAAVPVVGAPSGPLDGPAGAVDRPVLALCADGLAALLLTVPALRALRRAYPGRRVLVASAGDGAALLVAAGVADGVVPLADGVPPGERLSGAGRHPYRPHTAVNLRDAGPAGHRLLLAGGPDDVLWFACTPPLGSPDPAWGLDSGPPWDAAVDEATRWCRLVAATGVPVDPADLGLPPLPGEDAAAGVAPSGAVVVHPGGRHGGLPAAGWAAVARGLAADGHEVVVTGTGAEASLVARVVADAGLVPSAGLAGRLSLTGLAGLVRSARLVVAGDTGPAHLAVATGTPSVRVAAVPSRGPAVPAHDVLRGGGPDDVLAAARRRLDVPVAPDAADAPGGAGVRAVRSRD